MANYDFEQKGDSRLTEVPARVITQTIFTHMPNKNVAKMQIKIKKLHWKQMGGGPKGGKCSENKKKPGRHAFWVTDKVLLAIGQAKTVICQFDSLTR